jgi:hypothetical protein
MHSRTALLLVLLTACSSNESPGDPTGSGGSAGTGGSTGGSATAGTGGSSAATGGTSSGSGGTGGSTTAGRGGSSAGKGGSGAAGSGSFTPLPPSQIPPVDPNASIIPNLDSAVINVEAVEGAKDYRAFVVEDGVEILTDEQGHEVVNGATIYCAGLRQRAAPKLDVPEVMRQIEVLNVTKKTEFVVEAIDELCPFVGLHGKTDDVINITSSDTEPSLVVPVPVVSEATVRARYGSMIYNGQGPAAQPGQPAEPNAPKVLKRWTVEVEPLSEEAAEQRKTKDFFEDFSEEDPFEWVPGGTNPDGSFHQPDGYGYGYAIYQNSRFSFYATNTEAINGNHVFFDRGQLQTLLPDVSQAVMGALFAIPKKLAHFKDGAYVHVTFEGSTNSTARRYWWLSLCGAEEAGQTLDEDGLLTSHLSLNSGFFNPDGRNPSTAGWNCLIVFPHDGLQTPVPPSSNSNPQSSVIVLIHKANAPVMQTAVNVSPQQLNPGYPAAWYRQMRGGEVTDVGILDDLIQHAPRSHFDFYISRNRVVMYVNGEQRLCNDFGPEALTMAEASVGFNDALYHSSAEHGELTMPFADRSGQLHYLQNLVFADQHAWDNVGFEEDVGLPSSFSDADCYTYAP